jgi:hypothetical protein
LVILHTFLALVSGFATVVLLALVLTALLKKIAPHWAEVEGRPGPGAVLANMGSSFLSATAGGYVTAWAAAGNPLIQVLALALVVLLLAALSALQAKGKQPIWFQLALVAIAPLGVLAGGLLRLRVLGIL